MYIKPLYDRVLVVPFKENHSTQIIMPSDNKSEKMKVLALGKDTTGEVKLGDIVLVNKYAGGEFEIEGENYTLIKECDILAVVEGNNE